MFRFNITIIPSGANTYTFSGGSAVVSPTSNTSYSVSGTSSAGCISSSPAVSAVTVVSSPTANAGSSKTITCTSPIVSLNGGGVATYTWSGPGLVSGVNSASPTVNTAGTYSLIGSSNGCNSDTATVIVFSNTLVPFISASSSNSVICGPPFQQTSTLSASGNSTSYTWSTGGTATSISISPSVTTQYTVTGMAPNGCTNSVTITQFVSTCASVSQISKGFQVLEIYPNPFIDKITIVAENSDELVVRVINSLGSIIHSKKIEHGKIEVDLGYFASGIYFVSIFENNQLLKVEKIIKE